MLIIQDYFASDYVGNNYVGTLNLSTLEPNYGASVSVEQRIIEYTASYQQRDVDGINETSRKWNVTFTGTSLEVSYLDSLLSNYKGKTHFAWQPPVGSSGNWICMETSITEDGFSYSNLSATFEEVFV